MKRETENKVVFCLMSCPVMKKAITTLHRFYLSSINFRALLGKNSGVVTRRLLHGMEFSFNFFNCHVWKNVNDFKFIGRIYV